MHICIFVLFNCHNSFITYTSPSDQLSSLSCPRSLFSLSLSLFLSLSLPLLSLSLSLIPISFSLLKMCNFSMEGWTVCLPVCHNFQKGRGREVTLSCYDRRTSLFKASQTCIKKLGLSLGSSVIDC